MKFISRLVPALLGLALIAQSAAAQAGPVPTISSITAKKAWDPGYVIINGSSLGLVTQVKLNGVPIPIFRVKSNRILAGPVAPQDPGFGTVLISNGSSGDTGPIEFLPTLKAVRRGARLVTTLNNGEAGTYILRYSYQSYGPASTPGIYGPRFLGANSAVLFAGVFPDSGPVQIPGLYLPVEIGFLGNPLRVQAECYAATSNVTAYTNFAEVPGYGITQ